MPDVESVMQALKDSLRNQHCGFIENVGNVYAVSEETINKTLGLLEEQEAARPKREYSGGGTTWWNICGNCRTAINPNDKFCHECGKKVKWE